MLAILIITGIIVAISLLDFYTSKNWQNVTSVTRNNAVFEKRNQDYGAYEIRKDYNRSFVIILLIVFLGGGGLTSMALAGREVKKAKIITKVVQIDPTAQDEKPKIEEEKEEEQTVAKKESAPASIAYTTPIISNLIQDTFQLPDPGKLISNITNDDDDPFGVGKKKVITDGKDDKTVISDTIVGIERLTEFAMFVGGRPKMLAFINENFSPREVETNVTVYTKFVVSSNGEVRNFKVTNVVGDCYDCETKAYELLKMMPKWIPAKVNGVPVTSYFTMPIKVKVN